MPQKRPNKVGIVRFSALGDVALSIPAIYDACVANPDVSFLLLTRKPFQALFVNAPANLTVRGVDLKKEYTGVGGISRLAKELDVDTFIDLHSVLRTWIMDARLRMRGVNVVVFDKARADKRRLVKNGAGTAPPVTAVTKRYADAFHAAGLNMTHSFNGLYANAVADATLYANVHAPRCSNDDELWIGVAPFAAHQGKIYPLDMTFRAVREMIDDNPRTRIFLFGGGDTETKLLRDFAVSCPPGRTFCVAGSKIGFGGELALMSHLDVMVSMDSGNMHLAAVAGTRTISIWGATHPAAGFSPWAVADSAADWHRTLQVHRDCRPCSVFGNKPCKYVTNGTTPPCMSLIDPLSVAFAALDIHKKPII